MIYNNKLDLVGTLGIPSVGIFKKYLEKKKRKDMNFSAKLIFNKIRFVSLLLCKNN